MKGKEISDNEKKLLLVLAALIVLVIAYQFGYVNFSKKTQAVEEELVTLNSKLADLQEKASNEATYKKEIKEMDGKRKKTLAQFPSKVTGEKTIRFAREMEDKTFSWVTEIAFDSTVDIYSKMKKVEQPVLDDAGNDTGQTQETEVIDTDGLIAYNTPTALRLEANYAEFKAVVDYILKYHDRITISALKARYTEETGRLNVEMNLNQYVVNGPAENSYVPPTEGGIPIGNKNIFSTVESKTNAGGKVNNQKVK